MDKFQHPFIVCHHKLKLSSLEQLARQFGCTIQHDNSNRK